MVSNNSASSSADQGVTAMACENGMPLMPAQGINTRQTDNSAGSIAVTAANTNSSMVRAASDNDYGLTTPMAPEGGLPVFPGSTAGSGADSSQGSTPSATPSGSVLVWPGIGSSGGSSGNNSDNDYGLTHPIAPEGGSPVWPGGNTSGGNSGSGSGGGSGNSGSGNSGSGNSGSGSSGGTTIWPVFPWFPTCPSCGGCLSCGNCPGCNSGSGSNSGSGNPGSSTLGQVRFLNASTANTSVSVTFDNTIYATNIGFGTISAYRPIADGFHTVSVRRTTGLQALVVQQSFPFAANQKYTLVLVDTAAGGVNLIQVDDTGCSNLSSNTGCYRVANMAYSGSSFDVFLYSHDAVFKNVGFQEVTSYKQAIAGSYQFYITNSTNYSVIRELPVLIIGAAGNLSLSGNPLVSYSADIAAGKNYTSYLIGNSWSDLNFRVLTVED